MIIQVLIPTSKFKVLLNVRLLQVSIPSRLLGFASIAENLSINKGTALNEKQNEQWRPTMLNYIEKKRKRIN